jgi:hypothetical protein
VGPAKEKLLRDILDLAEADAAHAHIVIERSAEPEMAELPEAWKTLESGAPAPNWVAGLDEARRDIGLDPDHYHGPMAHATNADASVVKRRREAAEQLRGMFAHVAPGVSLADELIADRRAEVRAEERAEAERQRAKG